MAKSEVSGEELVGMIERGERCSTAMRRRHVLATFGFETCRIRSLAYSSGMIRVWENDFEQPTQDL